MRSEPANSSSATILLVEDDTPIRRMIQTILESHGHEVLQAEDSTGAFQLTKQHAGRIHLLISDVVLPGMIGTELARELCTFHPGLKVILMSAYPQGVLALNQDWQFIEKPFLPQALVEKVHAILGEPS